MASHTTRTSASPPLFSSTDRLRKIPGIPSALIMVSMSSVPSTIVGAVPTEIHYSNYTVPNVRTTYACQAFSLPATAGHIAAIEPLVPPNAHLVHHAVLHVCSSDTPMFAGYLNNPSPCNSPVGNQA